ncbi:MAG: GntR family transcriptional regulator [Pirellulales bacterium]|nr:GntR family transcriptional regulator [Pirellulales bacterium]
MSKDLSGESIYDRVVRHIFFSGELPPGSKVVEKVLADQLGVSRIPIRETLGKLAGQGLLVDGLNGQGVRLRRYTAEETRQLYELRELLEGGAARAAARAANDADITRMEMICNQSESEIGDYGSQRWADLDHAFHAALADASHNDRIARLLKLMLTECHYLFYLYPSAVGRPTPAHEDAVQRMQSILNDHRVLLQLICAGDADGAERKAREDMRVSSARFTQALIASDLHR